MIVNSKFKTAKKIIKNEGIFSLFKKGFKYDIFSFLYLPFVYIKLNHFKSENIHKMFMKVLC